MLIPGDPVPAFHARALANPRYAFATVAGRYAVLTFIAGTRAPGVAPFLARLAAHRGAPFDDRFAALFLVSADPADFAGQRLHDRVPGIRVLNDHDLALADLFGARVDGPDRQQIALGSWVLDPGQRVIACIPWEPQVDHLDQILAALRDRPAPADQTDRWAPVLSVPQVFEPEMCRELIAYCERAGTEDSGFMRTDPATGQTVAALDHGHKRRRDCQIEDEALRQAIRARVHRRLVPAIAQSFQFQVTRMERYIVARYDDSGGYFRPHQDNTTLGTAHRRFAVSINLNDDFDGGDLRFPAFGPRTYRPSVGGAVVFSCSLVHEATPVTRGVRYAVLPFLYDDAAADVRLANARHLADAELRQAVVESVTARP